MIGALPSNIIWLLSAVFGLLICASLVPVTLHAGSASASNSEVGLRIRTWWVLVTVVSAAVALGWEYVVILIAAISFFALREFISLCPATGLARHILFWSYFTIPLQYTWVGTGFYDAFMVYIPVYVFAFLPLRMLIYGNPRGFTASAGSLFFGIMACVFGLSHAAYLVMLPADGDDPITGIGLFLFLIFLSQLNDVAQFCIGRALGGPKIVPHISPNKTWAGMLGGVAVTAAFAVAIGPFLTPFTIFGTFSAGLLIACAGFGGDVLVSALKRDAGVKDSAFLLPGHGGILDRVDSLILSAPLFFHFCRYLYFS